MNLMSHVFSCRDSGKAGIWEALPAPGQESFCVQRTFIPGSTPRRNTWALQSGSDLAPKLTPTYSFVQSGKVAQFPKMVYVGIAGYELAVCNPQMA